MPYELYDMGFICMKASLAYESCYVAGLNATCVTSGFTQSGFSNAKDSVRRIFSHAVNVRAVRVILH